MVSDAGNFLLPFLALLVAPLLFIILMSLSSRIFHVLSHPSRSKRNQTQKKDELLQLLLLTELLRNDTGESSSRPRVANVDEDNAKDRKSEVCEEIVEDSEQVFD